MMGESMLVKEVKADICHTDPQEVPQNLKSEYAYLRL
jgi:hypothetical protein